MSAGRPPGVELLLELVRGAAGERRCPACGDSLEAASVEPKELDDEHLVVRILCRCGAAERVEVRPASDGGRAEIR